MRKSNPLIRAAKSALTLDMAEYTSTREGFQRAMKEALIGKPEEVSDYLERTGTAGFYHFFNGDRQERDAYLSSLSMWRTKITDYDPVVKEFLRDGDQLAARMDGVIKLDGAPTFFESFLFAKVDAETGKMEHLIERSVWGKPGEAPSHGAEL